MPPFRYRRLSQQFVDELSDKIWSGESLAMLGPRYSGKRFVIFNLIDRLRAMGAENVIQLSFLTSKPINTEELAREYIEECVGKAYPSLPPPRYQAAGLFDAVDRLSESIQTGDGSPVRPLILLAANVDGMAHHMTRLFLECLRTRAESGKVIAVLSGEDNFHDLMLGPDPGFSCANYYVLQGLAEEEFYTYVDLYCGKLNITFDNRGEAHSRLWRLTGGNLYGMRVVLRTLMEARAQFSLTTSHEVAAADIPDPDRVVEFLRANESRPYRHAAQIISREPDSWEELQTLLREGEVIIPLGADAPGRLEFAGIGIRENSSRKARLRFASPLVEAFVRGYYDDKQFGDMYASVNQWDKAFSFYRRLPPESRIRPSGADDVSRTESIVSTLCSALYTESTRGVSEVEKLMRLGCTYLLGAGGVYLWRCCYQRATGSWVVAPLGEQGAEEGEFYQGLGEVLTDILVNRRQPTSGLLSLPTPWSRYVVGAMVRDTRKDQYLIATAGDISRASLSREREGLLKRILSHYVKAYDHAVRVDIANLRLGAREKHLGIIDSIFSSLADDSLSVRDVLRKAARGLRRLAYRRVTISLVDPEERMIQGWIEESYDQQVQVAAMINQRLDEEGSGLHARVVKEGRPEIFHNARAMRTANQTLVQTTGVTSGAILPLINPVGVAIGAMFVEREDGFAPTETEVEDLMFFGRLLTMVMEQSERVNLLEAALNGIPEPVAIVDRAERPRYMNDPAARLLGGRKGWRNRTETTTIGDLPGAGSLAETIRESLTTEHRLADHLNDIGVRKSYRGAVLTDIVRDWRPKTIGALLHIQDINYLHKIFNASLLIGKARNMHSALEALLKAAEMLGHEWGRLYLIQEESPDTFVSTLSYGYADEAAADFFKAGKVRLASRKEPHQIEWMCLALKRPLVFCWKEELADGESYVTQYGLRAINCKEPRQPDAVKKRPGDLWIDFPLATERRELGKICLQCDDELRPENFKFLTVLSEICAEFLEAFAERELENNMRERLIKVEAAETTMAALAHNIATRLAGLPALLSRYRLRESKLNELKDLNKDFEHIVREALTTVRRANEMLAPKTPNFECVDIVAELEKTLRSALPADGWAVECSERPLNMQVDANLFETALLELVQNSRDAAAGTDLFISVRAESVLRGPKEWVRITYRDNGPGVPEQHREVIFNDFFSDKPRGRKAGTGLGMGFVRRVVENHKGVIALAAPGAHEGAEFVIVMPRNHGCE